MIICFLNYLAIDGNNGGITQKMDSPGGSVSFLPYFLKEFVEKFFNEFYVGTVDKFKLARPVMVSLQGS